MNVTVCLADKNDIAALVALENECFSEPWSETAFVDFIDGGGILYKAESDGKVVGYAGMYLSFGDGSVTNIAVTAAYRRNGIGAALLKALSDTPDTERLFLEVRESNQAALSLYEKYGFTKDGIRKNFYSHPRENAILMSIKF